MLAIRKAIRTDLDNIINLCEAHATFEGAEFKPGNNFKTELGSFLFDRDEVTCLVAEANNRLIGYATCMEQLATWAASPYLYMDCLFIEESYRGQGIGLRFMSEIKDIMKEKRLSEIQWQTPATNSLAISFYKKVGAIELPKSRFSWQP